MSEALKIATLLAGATEANSPTVYDRVLMANSSGDLRRTTPDAIRQHNVWNVGYAEAGESGWLRVVGMGYDAGGIITVHKYWGTDAPAFGVFNFLCHSNGVVEGSVLSALNISTIGMLEKFRIVYKPNTPDAYVDVYAPLRAREKFYVNLIAATSAVISLGTETNAEIPESYKVKEFTITENSARGGVNQRFTTTYELREETVIGVGDCLLRARRKGGHHERSTKSHILESAELSPLFGEPCAVDSFGQALHNRSVHYAGCNLYGWRHQTDTYNVKVLHQGEVDDILHRRRRMVDNPERRRRYSIDIRQNQRYRSVSGILSCREAERRGCIQDLGCTVSYAHGGRTTNVDKYQSPFIDLTVRRKEVVGV